MHATHQPATTRPPRRAFTLIELVVVIVVIGILAGIAAVSYRTVMSRSADEVFLENQRNVARDVSAILAFQDGTSPSVALATALAETSSAAAPGLYAAGCTWAPTDPTAPLGAIGVPVTVCGWVLTQTSAPDTPPPGHVSWQEAGTTGINFQAADGDAPHATSCAISTGSTACTSAGIAPASPPTTTEPPATVTVPSVPQGPSATPNSAQATVSFTPPADNGGAPITSYTVTSNPGGVAAHGTTSPITVTGLTNGTSYTFTVTATNSAGTSAASAATSPVTPVAKAGQVQHVTATGQVASIDVAWDELASTAAQPITGYRIYLDGELNTSVLAGTTTTTIIGLANATAYNIEVAAYGPAGQGTASAAVTATTLSSPATPDHVTVTVAPSQLGVSWEAVASASTAPLTGYRIYLNDALAATLPATTTSTTLADLTNGTTYTVQVTAYGPAGESAPSAAQPATPIGEPTAPVSVSLAAGDSTIDVTWDAVADTAAAPVTGYRVFVGGVLSGTYSAATTSATITQLTNGVTYTVQVATYGPAGQSSASAAQYATPRTVPATPTAVGGTAGNAAVLVSFTAPVNGGSAIVDYTVTAAPGGVTATGSSSPINVTGLTNGTAYTFTVTARNAAGSSNPSASSGSITPRTVPDAPTAVAGVRGTPMTSATVSWTAPTFNGGAAITSYTVSFSVNGHDWTPYGTTFTASPATINGLSLATSYYFQVVATNIAGDSAAGIGLGAVSGAVQPAAPTAVSATPGDSQATVTWTAPTSDGGSPITDYEVSYAAGGAYTVFAHPASTTTSLTVTGLANATAYTFKVRALTAVGYGPLSGASAGVTPAPVPQVIYGFQDGGFGLATNAATPTVGSFASGVITSGNGCAGGAYVNDLEYGNGVWVAVGYSPNGQYTRPNIARSTDGGNSWTNVLCPTSQYAPLNDVAFDASTNTWIALTGGPTSVYPYAGYYYSTNNGATWTLQGAPTGLGSNYPVNLANNGAGRWWMSTMDGVYTSTNPIGGTWTSITPSGAATGWSVKWLLAYDAPLNQLDIIQETTTGFGATQTGKSWYTTTPTTVTSGTWTTRTTNSSFPTVNPNSYAPQVAARNGLVVIAVGFGTTIYYSTDSMSTWKTTSMTTAPQSVKIDASDVAIVAGDRALTYRNPLTQVWTASTTNLTSPAARVVSGIGVR